MNCKEFYNLIKENVCCYGIGSTEEHSKYCLANPEMKSCFTCKNHKVPEKGREYCEVNSTFFPNQNGLIAVHCRYWNTEPVDEKEEKDLTSCYSQIIDIHSSREEIKQFVKKYPIYTYHSIYAAAHCMLNEANNSYSKELDLVYMLCFKLSELKLLNTKIIEGRKRFNYLFKKD